MGEDFLSVNQTVVFSAGSTEAFLNVPILDDLLNESTETFSLQLSEPDGATIATPTLTVTLFDQEYVEIAPNAVRIGARTVHRPALARFERAHHRGLRHGGRQRCRSHRLPRRGRDAHVRRW
jgi:hypothetical protein